MTRFLSESLQATEPFFRLGLRRLEAANGNPNTDIRFTTEVLHATQSKLRELGLDPLLDLDMRLGEASGAAVAILLLRAALACHNGMATFAEAGVSSAGD